MLSGGNLDAGMLQVIVRFGLTRNGRFLRLRTQMPDRPGALKRLTDLFAEHRVNILDIDYHRDGAIELGVNDVRVLISIETRDFEHGERVIELISAAGYPAERLLGLHDWGLTPIAHARGLDSPRMSPHKIILDEASLPTHWYNLNADLPLPAPPLHPGTHQPVGPEDLAPLFPMSIILQEVSGEAQHEIPEEVREAYRIWRPTPLMRAERFEQALGLKGVRIYYKYEGGSPSGSHKPNTAVPQAFYCAQDGRKRIATETGAGQWGSALAYATQLYGLECEVFMVGISYRQKPYRRIMMETFGATVHSSPSKITNAGRRRSRPIPSRSARSASRSRRPSSAPPPIPRPPTRWARCSTTC